MQGKTKGFFEDTGIILVLAASIYSGYYIYTEFFSNTENSSKILVIEDINKVKNDLNVENNNTVILPTIIPDKIKETPVEIFEEKEKIIIPEKTIIKKIVPSSEIKPKKKITKNNNLPVLRKFLRKLKFNIASKIVKYDDLDISKTKMLKIRITLLPNGNYEQLAFVSGDKKLFEKNKENILKVFPVEMKEEIKSHFPRYVRVSIK